MSRESGIFFYKIFLGGMRHPARGMGGSAAGCAAGSAAGLVPPVPLRALQRGAGTLSRLPGRAGARPHTTRGGEQTHK
nr:MAG TPA: hydrolase [Caudoviricetes sp.]